MDYSSQKINSYSNSMIETEKIPLQNPLTQQSDHSIRVNESIFEVRINQENDGKYFL